MTLPTSTTTQSCEVSPIDKKTQFWVLLIDTYCQQVVTYILYQEVEAEIINFLGINWTSTCDPAIYYTPMYHQINHYYNNGQFDLTDELWGYLDWNCTLFNIQLDLILCIWHWYFKLYVRDERAVSARLETIELCRARARARSSFIKRRASSLALLANPCYFLTCSSLLMCYFLTLKVWVAAIVTWHCVTMTVSPGPSSRCCPNTGQCYLSLIGTEIR